MLLDVTYTFNMTPQELKRLRWSLGGEYELRQSKTNKYISWAILFEASLVDISIVSDVLVPTRCQAITSTSDDALPIGSIGRNFSGSWIKIPNLIQENTFENVVAILLCLNVMCYEFLKGMGKEVMGLRYKFRHDVKSRDFNAFYS